MSRTQTNWLFAGAFLVCIATAGVMGGSWPAVAWLLAMGILLSWVAWLGVTRSR